MASKKRTPIPRPPTRKRKTSARPVPPRPKGELERLAVRRLAAMKYRLAGASYGVIAEKLTETRALEYADAHGISVDRAMKKIKHVSSRTAWDDVLAEFEGLRRETEITRGDAMAMENTRLDQVFSKALSLFANGSVPVWPTGYRDDGTALPFRCRIVAGTRPAASRCRGTRRTLRTRRPARRGGANSPPPFAAPMSRRSAASGSAALMSAAPRSASGSASYFATGRNDPTGPLASSDNRLSSHPLSEPVTAACWSGETPAHGRAGSTTHRSCRTSAGAMGLPGGTGWPRQLDAVGPA